MRERRALRFLVEALFLGALAAALVVADLEPLYIAGVMLLGWIVVAFYEWAATRELPHYGRGLPPRYYVPQIALPPPRQLEQLRSGYPAAATDDQATWIATPAMRAEALAEWPVNPVGGPLPPPGPGEDTIVVDLPFPGEEEFHEDTWIELDPIAEGRGRDDDPVPVVVVEEIEAVEVEPAVVDTEVEPEPEAVVDIEPDVVELPEPRVDAVPEEAVEPVPEDEPVVEPVEAAAALVVDEPEAAVEDADGDVPEDIEPAAVAAALAAADTEEPPEADADNGSDPAIAAGAAVAAVVSGRDAPVEAEQELAEEAEPDNGVDPAIAAAAAAVVGGRDAPVEAEQDVAEEAEPDDGIDPAIAAAAVAAAAAVVTGREAPVEAEQDMSEADNEVELGGAAVGVVLADQEALADPDLEDDTKESAVAVAPEPVPERPARHTFDPLAGHAPTRRRWRRRDDPWVEVPSRPPTPMVLPGSSRREP